MHKVFTIFAGLVAHVRGELPNCEAGFKPNAAKTACEACDVDQAASYGSGCTVDTCKTGFKPNAAKTACDPCDVDKVKSNGVKSCSSGCAEYPATSACSEQRDCAWQ